MKIGLIVNPIAGMGGRVGLKGTDGEAYKIALKMGAKPVTPERTVSFLKHLKSKDKIYIVTAPKKMGEDYVKTFNIQYEVVGSIREETTADDTKRIAKEIIEKGIDLLIFVGGDGTARDIFDSIDMKVPVLGIPSGVKMFSSVFAVSPKAAAEIVDGLLNDNVTFVEREVLDIDEEAYRRDILKIKLYGFLKIPVVADLVQVGKEPSRSDTDVEENKKAIAKYVIELMEPDTLYLIGPGTTTKAITDELGLEKTLLGVDALYNETIIKKDLNERAILDLLNKYPRVKAIISPIGGQGFIFGRGNQQFSPEVLKKLGKENIVVISTRDKLRNIRSLRVDTGDEDVDKMLRGYIRVIVDYQEEKVMKVK